MNTFNLNEHCWSDEGIFNIAAYEATAKKLAGLCRWNFRTYEAGASSEVKAAGPV